MEDHIEVSHRHAHSLCTFFPIEIVEEAQPEGFGVAGVQALQCGFHVRAGVVGVDAPIGGRRCRVTVGLRFEGILEAAGAMVGAVNVDGAVDGDAAKPKVDGAVGVGVVGLGPLQHDAEGVDQHVLGQLADGESWEDDLPEQRIPVPGIERARRAPIAAEETLYDRTFVGKWLELGFVDQGALLGTPTLETGGGLRILHCAAVRAIGEPQEPPPCPTPPRPLP